MVCGNAIIQTAFDDILKVAEDMMMSNGDARVSTTGAPLNCYTGIDTVIMGVNVKRYTVNFDQGCSSYDGKIRSGTVVFDLEGTNYNVAGAKLTVTLSNYSFSGNVMTGNMVVTNEGSGIFKVVITGQGSDYATLNLTALDKNVRWKGTLRKSIVSGDGDNIMINNVYHITTPDQSYFMEGITSDGVHYKATISIDLVLDNRCNAVGFLRYPVAGTINYVIADKTYRSLDYGAETDCDTKYTLIFDSESTSNYLY